MRTDDDGPSAAHDGTIYYFCSTTCKRSFGETPSKYADRQPEIEHHDHDH